MTGMATYTGAFSDTKVIWSADQVEQSLPKRPSAAGTYCEGDTGQAMGQSQSFATPLDPLV